MSDTSHVGARADFSDKTKEVQTEISLKEICFAKSEKRGQILRMSERGPIFPTTFQEKDKQNSSGKMIANQRKDSDWKSDSLSITTTEGVFKSLSCDWPPTGQILNGQRYGKQIY